MSDPPRKKSVLIVDDGAAAHLLLGGFLRGKNYEVFHAYDGVEAVNVFKENAPIDIVLMDMKMPNMGGETALYKLREIDPDVRVIAQTTNDLNQKEEELTAVGFSGFLEKPIDLNELLKVIAY